MIVLVVLVVARAVLIIHKNFFVSLLIILKNLKKEKNYG